MPLSEHEQRLLDQIERALYAEDPKFASTVRSTDLRTHMRRRLRRAGIVLALGFVLLVAGAVTAKAVVGVAGFVVMLGALVLVLARQATAPTIAVVAQIPAFVTVALITQYAVMVWFMIGLALSAQAARAEAIGGGASGTDEQASRWSGVQLVRGGAI